MENLTTTSILALFQTDKSQRQSFAEDLVSKIESGEVDPLIIHLQIKCMEDIAKIVNSNTIYKKSVLDAAERYGEKTFQFHNSKVEIKEVGVKYDFSNCEDPVYKRVEQKLEAISTELKQRADFLKTVPLKGMIVTDEETGETFTVYPPAKSSTTSIAVTLK